MRRPGERLIAAWVPSAFDAAVTALAREAGLSKSEVVRQTLTRACLRTAEDRDERDAAHP